MPDDNRVVSLYGTMWPIVALMGITYRVINESALAELTSPSCGQELPEVDARPYQSKQSLSQRHVPYRPRNLGARH